MSNKVDNLEDLEPACQNAVEVVYLYMGRRCSNLAVHVCTATAASATRYKKDLNTAVQFNASRKSSIREASDIAANPMPPVTNAIIIAMILFILYTKPSNNKNSPYHYH